MTAGRPAGRPVEGLEEDPMIHSLPMKGLVAETGRTIRITFKLFALLERYLPDGASRNEIGRAHV
jgi:hypothetical protein